MFSKQNKTEKIISIILIIVICITGTFSLQEYISYKYSPRFNFANFQKLNNFVSKNNTSLSIEDINSIDTWMTFGYINMIFKLPPNYLKDSLNISDVHYPNVPISTYVKDQDLDKNLFLEGVKKTIRDYFINRQ